MNILILSGSPRVNSNTSAFVKAFQEGAEGAGHHVTVFPVGTMNIRPCLGCEYCHGKGEGSCIQNDDMQKIYPAMAQADLVVLASPVHYWGFSGQMQSAITRFYAPLKPKAKKYALILSSGSDGVYDAIITQYHEMLTYIGAEDAGIRTVFGYEQQTEENLTMMRTFGAEIG